MNKGCGNCLYHGDSKADENGSRIFCMYDNFWYKDTYFCEKWTEYSYHLTNEHRLKMAMELKKKEENKKQHQDLLEMGKRDKNFQVKIVFFLFCLAY